MQQYINEITPELYKSFSQPSYDEDSLEGCASKIREEFEDVNKQVSRPLTYIFRFAVVGNVTRNGRKLRNASGGSTDGGYKMARFGDKVVYADGSEATIISGAGAVRVMQGASAALVGSMLDNGDKIISTPQSSNSLIFREGDGLPNGFLNMPGSKR